LAEYYNIDYRFHILLYIPFSQNLDKIGKEGKMRAIVKLRCGNMELTNKYWLKKKQWRYIFCEEE